MRSGTIAAPAPGSAAAALPRCWPRWTKIIGACSRRDSPGLSATAYVAFYREMLGACRAAAAAATGDDRAFYESLEGLVQPWVTLEVLARADGEILSDLHRRCQRAEARLRGRKGGPSLAMTVGAAAGIAVLIVVTALTFALDWWPPWLTVRLRAAGTQAWRFCGQVDGTVQAIIVGVVVVLIALALLGRSRS